MAVNTYCDICEGDDEAVVMIDGVKHCAECAKEVGVEIL
jgi:hypothetical protein